MRALVLSDLHGEDTVLRWMLEQVWKQTGPIDAYIFLGDGLHGFQRAENFIRTRDENAALWCVRGNCDFAADGVGDRLVVPFGGAKVFLTHGHRYQVKSTYSLLREAAKDAECSIALFGHTHTATVEPGVPMLVNPGAACDEKCAILEVDDGRPRIRLLNIGFY